MGMVNGAVVSFGSSSDRIEPKVPFGFAQGRLSTTHLWPLVADLHVSLGMTT